MNLTLSIDDEIVARAREAARQQGTSLNALVRQFLLGLAGRRRGADLAHEILTLLEEHPGDSGGKTVRRDDAHEGRV